MRRTRKEWLDFVKEYLHTRKKPIKMNDEQTRSVFYEYFNNNEIFVGYEFPGKCYVLIYSEELYDDMCYVILLLNHLDKDMVVAELDFDDEEDLRKYVVEHLHLEL